jgi:uncharacterized repeat protein (TIGR03806 family)
MRCARPVQSLASAFAAAAALLWALGCGEEERCLPHAGTADAPADLASWCMVSLIDGDIVPSEGVQPFELNTALFSDGALKRRTVWMPADASAQYTPDGGVLEFPEGTVFTKSFGFPDDGRKPSPVIRWIETRVEWRASGEWHAVSYLWDEAQTHARVTYAGEVTPVTWIDRGGETQTAHYLVPNAQQCRQCHQDAAGLTPLGPKPRNLNRAPANGAPPANQLIEWAESGRLSGLPPLDEVPRLPVWNDAATGTVAERARAYLEVNCSHCHRPGGSAENTGLVLTLEQVDPYHLGICKGPGGTGPGPGGRRWEIEPGHPENSAVVYRMSSTQPGIAMPQIGRSVVDTAAVALIEEWITTLPGTCP